MPKNISDKLDFSAKVYQQLFKELSEIDQFKGSWETLELKQSRHLKELRKIATIESIGSSTRIEGATLSDQEVEKLLQSVKIAKLESRDEQEVVGYYEALQLVLNEYDNIELSERYIHQLHGLLLKHSDKDQKHRGKYKQLSNQIVATYPDGSNRTIFKTTDPSLTAKEMEELLIWLKERLKEEDMHPVFVTAAFVYEFLSIHPYQDGNGRLSRLLTTLLLMRQAYGFTQYISFEHIIEERKEEYYHALMDGQKDRYQEEENIEKWVVFFVSCLKTLIYRLDEKYKRYEKLKKELNERQEKVLEFIREKQKVSIGEVNAAFKEESRNTLKKDLSYLVDEGILIKTGKLKGSRYHYPVD